MNGPAKKLRIGLEYASCDLTYQLKGAPFTRKDLVDFVRKVTRNILLQNSGNIDPRSSLGDFPLELMRMLEEGAPQPQDGFILRAWIQEVWILGDSIIDLGSCIANKCKVIARGGKAFWMEGLSESFLKSARAHSTFVRWESQDWNEVKDNVALSDWDVRLAKELGVSKEEFIFHIVETRNSYLSSQLHLNFLNAMVEDCGKDLFIKLAREWCQQASPEVLLLLSQSGHKRFGNLNP